MSLAPRSAASRMWERRCLSLASAEMVKPFSINPILPRITVSRLLKSCATPDVSWPTASSRCIWRRVDLHPFALFDLREQLSVGRLDLAGALSNSIFQCFIQPA